MSGPAYDGHLAAAYYCRTRSLDAGQANAALQLLSADERRRTEWFLRDTDRRDYIAAHALLRAALSSHTHVQPDRFVFEKDAAGRPFLVQADEQTGTPSFSLSHTMGLVACVIASGEEAAGVDVEMIDRSIDVLDLAGHVFSPDELVALRDCAVPSRAVRFFQLWTLNEALLKAQGVGLRGMSKLTSFDIEGQHVRVSLPPASADARWSFLLTGIESTHMLAVAISRTTSDSPIRAIAVDAAAAMSGALRPLHGLTANKKTRNGC